MAQPVSPFWVAACAAASIIAVVALVWDARNVVPPLVTLTARYRAARKTGDQAELTRVRAAFCDFIDGRVP